MCPFSYWSLEMASSQKLSSLPTSTVKILVIWNILLSLVTKCLIYPGICQGLWDINSPRISVVCIEPAAAEGQFHGGVGGGSQKAAACLPLHWSAALRQTEETDRRVGFLNSFVSKLSLCFYCSESKRQLVLDKLYPQCNLTNTRWH